MANLRPVNPITLRVGHVLIFPREFKGEFPPCDSSTCLIRPHVLNKEAIGHPVVILQIQCPSGPVHGTEQGAMTPMVKFVMLTSRTPLSRIRGTLHEEIQRTRDGVTTPMHPYLFEPNFSDGDSYFLFHHTHTVPLNKLIYYTRRRQDLETPGDDELDTPKFRLSRDGYVMLTRKLGITGDEYDSYDALEQITITAPAIIETQQPNQMPGTTLVPMAEVQRSSQASNAQQLGQVAQNRTTNTTYNETLRALIADANRSNSRPTADSVPTLGRSTDPSTVSGD